MDRSLSSFVLQIIELNKSAAEAYTMLMRGDPPPFMKFRDASNITPVFEISLQDCLAAVEKAMKFNFFDFSDFNSCEYEYYEVGVRDLSTYSVVL